MTPKASVVSEDECVVVVNSCDAYADVWPLFFAAFEDRWEHCRFPVVVNTESLKTAEVFPGVSCHVMPPGFERVAWGARLLSTLNDLSSEYVLMLFDDFVLEDNVDSEAIDQCIDWMNSDPAISVFYFSNIPGSPRPASPFAGFESLPPLTSYRLNSAPALWRRQHLIKLTREEDNPWIWELFGTSRTFFHRGKFFCARSNQETVYPYNYKKGGAIYRGKWVREVAGPLIERYRLDINLLDRGVSAEEGAPRTTVEKLQMIVQGFRASSYLAPVVMSLLLIEKVRRIFGKR